MSAVSRASATAVRPVHDLASWRELQLTLLIRCMSVIVGTEHCAPCRPTVRVPYWCAFAAAAKCVILILTLSQSQSQSAVCAGHVYSLVCSDSNYTPISFRFDKPVAVHFDRFAYERGEPRLFVLDFHRLIQIDLQPASLPESQVRCAGMLDSRRNKAPFHPFCSSKLVRFP